LRGGVLEVGVARRLWRKALVRHRVPAGDDAHLALLRPGVDVHVVLERAVGECRPLDLGEAWAGGSVFPFGQHERGAVEGRARLVGVALVPLLDKRVQPVQPPPLGGAGVDLEGREEPPPELGLEVPRVADAAAAHVPCVRCHVVGRFGRPGVEVKPALLSGALATEALADDALTASHDFRERLRVAARVVVLVAALIPQREEDLAPKRVLGDLLQASVAEAVPVGGEVRRSRAVCDLQPLEPPRGARHRRLIGQVHRSGTDLVAELWAAEASGGVPDAVAALTAAFAALACVARIRRDGRRAHERWKHALAVLPRALAVAP